MHGRQTAGARGEGVGPPLPLARGVAYRYCFEISEKVMAGVSAGSTTKPVTLLRAP